jgi:signal transduction histidine kinase
VLHEFLTSNRTEIIRLTRVKVAARSSPPHTSHELASGVPLFLDQLVDILKLAEGSPTHVIREAAATHGEELLRMGFTISQVVHDYGDVCQAVTELAGETNAPITVEEFHTLNRCLDDAIAGAVTEYSRLREKRMTSEETERSGVFAHELRNKLAAAINAFAALKSGRVGMGGSTSAVVDRNLRGIQDLINTSLAEVRIEAGKEYAERVVVAENVDAVVDGASLEAASAGIELTVMPGEGGLEVRADRAILSSAIANLLQNAFKFSRAEGRPPRVTLKITAAADRVQFAVQDECGGLPPGDHEHLFLPYTQSGVNRKGLGLGLYSSRKGIEAADGRVSVRDLPGTGCEFTIDVPRHTPIGEAA